MTNQTIYVPDIGGAEGAEVVELLVSVGDSVDVEQSLIVLESDKASMEIPASHAGVVVELKMAVGDQLAEGDAILVVEVPGETEVENNLLHGDAASEAFLSEIVGAQPWPNQRHWNMESIYEYGARAGFWRLHDLFTSVEIPLTVYGVATALARNPDQVAAMANSSKSAGLS